MSGEPALTLGPQSPSRAAARPARTVLRWHGGKWRLAPWIIAHFPAHRIYVEPFGGAGSVLLRKPRCYAEVYNDLDEMVVNLFCVLRDRAKSERLQERLRLTPFARDEFEAARTPPSDPVERARALVVRSFMGFGSNSHSGRGAEGFRSTGFRSNSNRSGTTPAHDWRAFPDHLPAIVERLRGVVVENRDAVEVMAQHDSSETLHYLDPPYLPETRGSSSNGSYRHEMDAAAHSRLLRAVGDLKGMVVLSGYPAPLYDRALSGWERFERRTFADGARGRVECLWLNPAAMSGLSQPSLLSAARR